MKRFKTNFGYLIFVGYADQNISNIGRNQLKVNVYFPAYFELAEITKWFVLI